jgi:hypothetical protein
MTLVYCNDIRNFLNFKISDKNIKVTKDFDNFIDYTGKKVIFYNDNTRMSEYTKLIDSYSFVLNNGNIERHYSTSFNSTINEFVDFYITLSKKCDLLIISTAEFYDSHILIHERLKDIENIYWVLPGVCNLHSDKFIFYGYWHNGVSQIYKKLPEKLNELMPFKHKEFYFDALLGRPKMHRDFVFKNISKTKDKFFCNYADIMEEGWITENGIKYLTKERTRPAEFVEYFGVEAHSCNILPIEIYNKTAYSIVAETEITNGNSYYTEKTIKPIIAKRLFVVFSGKDYLKNLRKQGFKTFDGIIDESYDIIENYEERMNLAWKQVEWLCNQNQEEIFEKIKPICEHNFEILTETDWLQQSSNKILNLMKDNH